MAHNGVLLQTWHHKGAPLHCGIMMVLNKRPYNKRQQWAQVDSSRVQPMPGRPRGGLVEGSSGQRR